MAELAVNAYLCGLPIFVYLDVLGKQLPECGIPKICLQGLCCQAASLLLAGFDGPCGQHVLVHEAHEACQNRPDAPAEKRESAALCARQMPGCGVLGHLLSAAALRRKSL